MCIRDRASSYEFTGRELEVLREMTGGDTNQEIAERLKGLAVRFIVAVNESGFFVPVAGQINYRVAFDKMDANLCIVTLSLTLQEQAGVCFDYGL